MASTLQTLPKEFTMKAFTILSLIMVSLFAQARLVNTKFCYDTDDGKGMKLVGTVELVNKKALYMQYFTLDGKYYDGNGASFLSRFTHTDKEFKMYNFTMKSAGDGWMDHMNIEFTNTEIKFWKTGEEEIKAERIIRCPKLQGW
jgi:hypothetical protein